MDDPQVTSSDLDSEQFSNNTYYFSSNPGGKFSIDPFSGNVTLATALDRESAVEHQLKVVAVDGFWRVETALTISVLDVNDNAPYFDRRVYYFNVSEMEPALTPVGRVSAQDADSEGINSKVSYALTKKSDAFALDSLSGELSTLKPLFFVNTSRPKTNRYQLTVVARDGGVTSKSGSASIVVFVTARNSFAPKFETRNYAAAVTTTSPSGSKVVRIRATDLDPAGPNSQISYSINKTDGVFLIDPATGWIRTTGLVGEQETEYALQVFAKDHGTPRKSAEAMVKISVLPSNKNSPKFPSSYLEASINENSPIGSSVLGATAHDLDAGQNGRILYRLEHQGENLPFAIDPNTGTIRTNSSLDFERNKEYNLTVVAEDGGFPTKSGRASLRIYVRDLNDNPPVFTKSKLEAFVAENSPGGTSIAKLEAVDLDEAPHNEIRYEFVWGNEDGLFYLDSQSGELSLTHKAFSLDFETKNLYHLTVLARNPGTELMGEASLLVHVSSVNEYAPRFLQKTYELSVVETALVGTVVGKVEAVDQDKGPDGVVFYYLERNSRGKGFSVDKSTGTISVSSKLNSLASVSLQIVAKNRQVFTRSDVDTCLVEITVKDGSSVPLFAQLSYSSQIPENSPPGTSIFSLSHYLMDNSIAHLKYSILDGNVGDCFAVDSNTGLVQVRGFLDREHFDRYDLILSVFSENDPAMSATCLVHVMVTDLNDNGPYLEEGNKVGYVMEGDPPGTNVTRLDPSDPDSPANRGPFKFRLANDEVGVVEHFEIDSTSGIIKSRKIFDQEQQGEYRLLIEITDSGVPAQSSTATVTIRDPQ